MALEFFQYNYNTAPIFNLLNIKLKKIQSVVAVFPMKVMSLSGNSHLLLYIHLISHTPPTPYLYFYCPSPFIFQFSSYLTLFYSWMHLKAILKVLFGKMTPMAVICIIAYSLPYHSTKPLFNTAGGTPHTH